MLFFYDPSYCVKIILKNAESARFISQMYIQYIGFLQSPCSLPAEGSNLVEITLSVAQP